MGAQFEVGLFEFDGPDVRIVGRSSDAELVAFVCEHFSAARRREIARFEGRAVRLVQAVDLDPDKQGES